MRLREILLSSAVIAAIAAPGVASAAGKANGVHRGPVTHTVAHKTTPAKKGTHHKTTHKSHKTTKSTKKVTKKG